MRKNKSAAYLYIESLSEKENEIKLKARAGAEKLGLEAISLSVVEARLVQFLLQPYADGKVVEIGTLTGLSAAYIAESLTRNGRLWTLEKSPEHAQLAADVLSEFISSGQCRILTGDAREQLQTLKDEGPFDAIFIDGNKAAYLDYFNWACAHVRPGGLIVADNVFLSGAVWGEQTAQKFGDKQIAAVQEMNRRAFADLSLMSVIVPTEEGMLICKKQS